VIYVKGVGPCFSLKDMGDNFEKGWEEHRKMMQANEAREAVIHAELLKEFCESVKANPVPIDHEPKP
jgi:hypothetical protein